MLLLCLAAAPFLAAVLALTVPLGFAAFAKALLSIPAGPLTACLPCGWCRKPACSVCTSMAPGLGICTRLALMSSSIRSCGVQA